LTGAKKRSQKLRAKIADPSIKSGGMCPTHFRALIVQHLEMDKLLPPFLRRVAAEFEWAFSDSSDRSLAKFRYEQRIRVRAAGVQKRLRKRRGVSPKQLLTSAGERWFGAANQRCLAFRAMLRQPRLYQSILVQPSKKEHRTQRSG